MKQIIKYSIVCIVLICFFGCGKDKGSSTYDLSLDAVGMYSGTWTIVGLGQAPGTCQITRVSDNYVNLLMTAGTESNIPLNGVKLSSGGINKINLSYSDVSGSLTGTVTGNTLTFTISAGSISEIFSGTK